MNCSASLSFLSMGATSVSSDAAHTHNWGHTPHEQPLSKGVGGWVGPKNFLLAIEPKLPTLIGCACSRLSRTCSKGNATLHADMYCCGHALKKACIKTPQHVFAFLVAHGKHTETPKKWAVVLRTKAFLFLCFKVHIITPNVHRQSTKTRYIQINCSASLSFLSMVATRVSSDAAYTHNWGHTPHEQPVSTSPQMSHLAGCET